MKSGGLEFLPLVPVLPRCLLGLLDLDGEVVHHDLSQWLFAFVLDLEELIVPVRVFAVISFFKELAQLITSLCFEFA